MPFAKIAHISKKLVTEIKKKNKTSTLCGLPSSRKLNVFTYAYVILNGLASALSRAGSTLEYELRGKIIKSSIRNEMCVCMSSSSHSTNEYAIIIVLCADEYGIFQYFYEMI